MELTVINLFLITIIVILLITTFFYFIKAEKESEKNIYEDQITGLKNRKFMEQTVRKLIEQEKTYDIIYCDIDFFKKVNDTYGHSSGDKVLEVVGDRLNQYFKKGKDIIVRYGGEEFVIFLERNENSNKEKIHERILEFKNKIETSTINTDGLEINITMSFGICYHDDNTPYDEQLKLADKALYNSKETGRNKITVSGTV